MISKTYSTKLWVLWSVVTVIGGTIGFTLGGVIYNQIENQVDYSQFNYYSPLYIIMVIAIAGLFIGISQWIIIRSRLKNSILWIPATFIEIPVGIFIGFIISDALPGFIFAHYDWIVTLVNLFFPGIIIGTIQWIVLHKQFDGIFSWITSSALSWGIGILGFNYFIVNTYSFDMDYGLFNFSIIGFVFSIIVGTISGAFVNRSLLVPTFDRR